MRSRPDSSPVRVLGHADGVQRAIDAVIFDLGGVLMQNGSPRDIHRNFGHETDKAMAVMQMLMGPHHEDSDHPWHRLERGEITMAECRAAQQEIFESAGLPLPSLGGGDSGGSGLAGYQYRTSTDGGTTWGTATPGASLTVTEQGETLVQYRTVDGAGNTGAWTPGGATNGSTVRIDRTGPGGNAGAELVTNGGFETPAASGPFSQRSADFGGWTLDSGDVDQVATYWAAAAGGQSLDLNGGAPGAISQTLATTPGDTYRITFQVAGNWSCAPAVKEMVVNWDGAALRTVRFDAGATSAVAMGWTQVSLEATATTASTVLQFQSLTAGQCGVTLDEVSVTDQAGPTVTGGSLSWLSQASTTVTASDATDLLSGMDVYEYRTSSDGGATWSPGTSGASAVVTLQGQTLVQFRAVDNAGNSGPWAPATPTAGSTVRLDRTTPSKPSVSGGSLSWRSVASVDVSASGSTDAGGSGLSGYENRTSTDGGATWSAPASGGTVTVGAEGETLVQFRAIDDATNTGPWSASATARIDRGAPTAPTAGGGSFAWQSVATITLGAVGATDAVSGVVSHEYRVSTDGGGSWSAAAAGAMVFVNAEGETLAQFRAVDAAGNEVGKGNLLIKLLQPPVDPSQPKSSYTAMSRPSSTPPPKPGMTKYGTPIKPK